MPDRQSGLLRELGLKSATLAVIGSVVGSGVFKKAGPMTLELHSPGLVLLAWLAAGIVTLLGALTNMEIASLIAEPGGQYVFFKRMYGRLFAFLYGWSSFAVIESGTIAGVGYVFAECVNEIRPLPHLSPALEGLMFFGILEPFRNFGTKVVTILAIGILTFLNRRGVVLGGYLSNLFSVLKLFGITLVIFFGLTLGQGNTSGPSSAHVFHSNFGFIGAFFSAMLGAFWAYQGWNSVTTLGGEVRDPKKNIPLAILIGVLSVAGIYLIVNFVYFYILPVSVIEKFASEENRIIAIESVRAVAGEGGAKAVTFLILLSSLGTLHVTILTASRIYFAMGIDGIFFRGSGEHHPVYRTPARSLVLQGVWASLLVLTGTFDQLTDRLIFAAFLFYGAGAAGVFILRRIMPDEERFVKAPGYPVLPGLFVLFCASLVIITIIRSPGDAVMGLIPVVAGLPFYFRWKRRLIREQT